MSFVRAYASQNPSALLNPFEISRRNVGPQDVLIDIEFCGVCHSDIHTARNEWGFTTYPCVPGHEIVGIVKEIGQQVTRFKIGQRVGVGCMVSSCGECKSCREGLEQYCEPGFIGTYNSTDVDGRSITYGGYSTAIVVRESFVLNIPTNLDPAAVAPLLCAGVTTWSPLRHWKVGAGKKVGIVGLGGLGHMGVKFARSFGAHAVVLTTSPKKVEDARKLGAHEVILTHQSDAMEAQAETFDFILDTVSADHDINHYLRLVRRDGQLVLVGGPEKPLGVASFSLIFRRRNFSGSLIGGIAETQKMLDYCGEKGITSDIELIPIQKINEAYERMLKSDVKYRFVIDMKSLR